MERKEIRGTTSEEIPENRIDVIENNNFDNERNVEFIFFEGQELGKEAMQAFEREILRLISNPDRFIDSGGAGDVFQLFSNREANLCVKIIKDRSKSDMASVMDLGNSPDTEARFQQIFSKFKIDGVRCPKCYGYWLSNDKSDLPAGIIMEQLDAVNLQHVILGKNDIEMPKGFDADVFFDGVSEFLEQMHEKGIVHDDIAARNLMVDTITGEPRIIDFGRTKPLRGFSERDRERQINEEWGLLEDIENQVRALTKSKK